MEVKDEETLKKILKKHPNATFYKVSNSFHRRYVFQQGTQKNYNKFIPSPAIYDMYEPDYEEVQKMLLCKSQAPLYHKYTVGETMETHLEIW